MDDVIKALRDHNADLLSMVRKLEKELLAKEEAERSMKKKICDLETEYFALESAQEIVLDASKAAWFLSKEKAARYAGVSAQTLKRRQRQGLLNKYKTSSGVHLYSIEELDRIFPSNPGRAR